MTTMRDMPERCDVWGCWATVQTWCPLCEQFLCAPHDATRHGCLGDRDTDEADDDMDAAFPEQAFIPR